jgi:hypothetical protein
MEQDASLEGAAARLYAFMGTIKDARCCPLYFRFSCAVLYFCCSCLTTPPPQSAQLRHPNGHRCSDHGQLLTSAHCRQGSPSTKPHAPILHTAQLVALLY